MQVDRLAIDFPGLNIIMSHGGLGFGDLGPTIAWRLPNVYIDYTTIHPRYLPAGLIGQLNSILKRKTIFGSGYPGMDYEIVEEWKKVIKPENQRLFFYENAAKLFGVEPAA